MNYIPDTHSTEAVRHSPSDRRRRFDSDAALVERIISGAPTCDELPLLEQWGATLLDHPTGDPLALLAGACLICLCRVVGEGCADRRAA